VSVLEEHPLLKHMTLRQLRRIAREWYSRMRKSQLLLLIQHGQHRRYPHRGPVQEVVETAKSGLRQEDHHAAQELGTLDQGLGELPKGYSENRIVLMLRDPHWVHAYWDVSQAYRASLQYQGGQQLALRLCDVTDINLVKRQPHSVQEFPCDDFTRQAKDLPITLSNRDYVVELGHYCSDGQWLTLAHSEAVRVPPVYPSGWVEDQFITVSWDEDLREKTFADVFPLNQALGDYDYAFTLAQQAEFQRVTGSLGTSGQVLPTRV